MKLYFHIILKYVKYYIYTYNLFTMIKIVTNLISNKI